MGTQALSRVHYSRRPLDRFQYVFLYFVILTFDLFTNINWLARTCDRLPCVKFGDCNLIKPSGMGLQYNFAICDPVALTFDLFIPNIN